eukprot:4703502-Prymnesium_polylepis.2
MGDGSENECRRVLQCCVHPTVDKVEERERTEERYRHEWYGNRQERVECVAGESVAQDEAATRAPHQAVAAVAVVGGSEQRGRPRHEIEVTDTVA